jgi:hypothetical protein
MQCRGIAIALVLVLVLAGTPTTHAQPALAPAQTEPAFEAELESRLARSAEAVQLASYHLGVMVAPRAARWVVSLVDQPTGRIVASVEIGPLPPDRDKAVAMMLQVVVDLEIRVTGRRRPREPVPLERRDEPSPPLSVEAQAERARRQAAELVFRRQALRFGPSYELGGQHTAGGGQGWRVFQGRPDDELEAPAFYQMLGRDDLADAYRLRHTLMLGGYVAGGLAFIAAGVLAVRKSDFSACSSQLDPVAYQRCSDDHLNSPAPAVIALGVGLAASVFASYFYRNPQPIDEHDAKALADAYNQQLRRQLGLPVAARRPIVRDLALAPYLSSRAAGLALAGSLTW